MTPISRFHAVVEGRVQGVGFRAYVASHAIRLDLSGWVRNTRSGDVEVEAQGPREVLDELVDLIRQGPRGSFVSRVAIDWWDGDAAYNGFDIRATV
ncbi:MAG: acylphosphatase [Anaerolineaceae bacterium]|nr:acylphosphatase [Anaerolineaceae bacterium]